MRGKKLGKFIVFEGIGGCGKGTQIVMMADWLRGQGKTVLVTCEHTRDTSPGVLIERIIKGKEPKIDSLALQLIFVADRANHTTATIVPGRINFDYVLGDRYEASTIAYAPEDKRKYLLEVNRGVIVRPDLTIILDVDPVIAAQRVGVRGDADIFDKAENLRKCREGYEWYSQNSGNNCVWVDGIGTREEVFERVKKVIQSV